MRKRDWTFLIVTVVVLAATVPPIIGFLRSSRPSDYYSHIPLIPVVSAYLIARRRREMFRGEMAPDLPGIAMIVAGAGAFLTARFLRIDAESFATVGPLAGLIFLMGAYRVFYGKGSNWHSVFPLAFLLFAIPMPLGIIESIVRILVVGSTFVVRLLFSAIGMPFVQESSVFHLPGFSIEVANECSSIRSSLALFITAILAVDIFLKRAWTKILLLFFVVPIAVFKNGIRIVTITLLAGFIDMRIIEGGFLHKSGGFIFFGLGLAILGLLLFFLKDLEDHQ